MYEALSAILTWSSAQLVETGISMFTFRNEEAETYHYLPAHPQSYLLLTPCEASILKDISGKSCLIKLIGFLGFLKICLCDTEYIPECTKKVLSAQSHMKTYVLLCFLWSWDQLIHSLHGYRRSVGAVCTNMPRCTLQIRIVFPFHLPETHSPSSFQISCYSAS